jgi:hypothetical protein
MFKAFKIVILRSGLSRTTARMTVSNSSVRLERVLHGTDTQPSGAENFDESL